MKPLLYLLVNPIIYMTEILIANAELTWVAAIPRSWRTYSLSQDTALYSDYTIPALTSWRYFRGRGYLTLSWVLSSLGYTSCAAPQVSGGGVLHEPPPPCEG